MMYNTGQIESRVIVRVAKLKLMDISQIQGMNILRIIVNKAKLYK